MWAHTHRFAHEIEKTFYTEHILYAHTGELTKAPFTIASSYGRHGYQGD